jgi:hypothetical protein
MEQPIYFARLEGYNRKKAETIFANTKKCEWVRLSLGFPLCPTVLTDELNRALISSSIKLKVKLEDFLSAKNLKLGYSSSSILPGQILSSPGQNSCRQILFGQIRSSPIGQIRSAPIGQREMTFKHEHLMQLI